MEGAIRPGQTILEPTSGAATVDGLSTLEPGARRAIGFLPEDSPLYDDQTPLQYLAFFARLYGLPGPAAQLGLVLRAEPQHVCRPGSGVGSRTCW